MTPEEWTAVRLSLLVATTATLASLPVGIAIAWLLARGRFWGKGLLDIGCSWGRWSMAAANVSTSIAGNLPTSSAGSKMARRSQA